MLNTLFNIQDVDSFFVNFWGKKHIVWSPPSFGIDFNVTTFKNLIREGNLFFPQLTCLDEKGHVNPLRYTKSDTNLTNCAIHQARVLELLSRGVTVRIRDLDIHNRFIKKLRSNFIDTFCCNVTINGYLSNKLSMGINPHYDVYHIFVIQVEGEKQWFIGPKSQIVPRFNYRPDYDPKNFYIVENITLKTGEMLYMPPGLWHQTKTENESLHLVFEVEIPDWTEYLTQLINYTMCKYSVMRSDLPFNVENDKFIYKRDIKNEMKKIVSLLKQESESFKYFVHKDEYS